MSPETGKKAATMARAARSSPKPIGLMKEAALWPRRDDPSIRSELVSRFLAYTKSIALRYRSEAENIDDLVQVAAVGLMNAIDRFDPDRGIPFMAFASPTIHGELKRHFRDRVSSLKVPRGVYERIGIMESTIADLRSSLAYEPRLEDIADAMSCSEGDILEAREATRARNPVSFGGEGDGEDGTFEDHLGDIDPRFESSEDRIVTGEALRRLSRRDRTMVLLRFRDEMTQTEIAEKLGCSQMHVSRRIRSILDSLNQAVTGATAP